MLTARSTFPVKQEKRIFARKMVFLGYPFLKFASQESLKLEFCADLAAKQLKGTISPD
jgi:hypothetical protein